jgi:alpha-ketoglutarate-dependent taurine dioxygenase
MFDIQPMMLGFVAWVSGIDLTRPLTPELVAAIEAGMDRYAVLVFHDQHFDDESQLAFSRNFGELEVSSGGEMSRPEERRLQPEVADISNLDNQGRLRAPDDLSAHIGTILGWPVPEARALIRDLTEHATQRQFVYAHSWRQWDLVMWDNRTTMHRARRYNDRGEIRDMHRTTIRGDGPTAPQVAEAA